jgi:hypothetical protein
MKYVLRWRRKSSLKLTNNFPLLILSTPSPPDHLAVKFFSLLAQLSDLTQCKKHKLSSFVFQSTQLCGKLLCIHGEAARLEEKREKKGKSNREKAEVSLFCQISLENCN